MDPQSNPSCQVLLLGFDPAAQDPFGPTPAQRLQEVLQVDETTARMLVQNAPAILKRHATPSEAAKYRDALTAIGARIEIKTPNPPGRDPETEDDLPLFPAGGDHDIAGPSGFANENTPPTMMIPEMADAPLTLQPIAAGDLDFGEREMVLSDAPLELAFDPIERRVSMTAKRAEKLMEKFSDQPPPAPSDDPFGSLDPAPASAGPSEPTVDELSLLLGPSDPAPSAQSTSPAGPSPHTYSQQAAQLDVLLGSEPQPPARSAAPRLASVVQGRPSTPPPPLGDGEMQCPSCARRQPVADSCFRCGIIYAKFDPTNPPGARPGSVIPSTAIDSLMIGDAVASAVAPSVAAPRSPPFDPSAAKAIAAATAAAATVDSLVVSNAEPAPVQLGSEDAPLELDRAPVKPGTPRPGTLWGDEPPAEPQPSARPTSRSGTLWDGPVADLGKPSAAPRSSPKGSFWAGVGPAFVSPFFGPGVVWIPLMAGVLLYVMWIVGLLPTIAGIFVYFGLLANYFAKSVAAGADGELKAPEPPSLENISADYLWPGVAVLCMSVVLFIGPAYYASSALPDIAPVSEPESYAAVYEEEQWDPEEIFFTENGERVKFSWEDPAARVKREDGSWVKVIPGRALVIPLGADGVDPTHQRAAASPSSGLFDGVPSSTKTMVILLFLLPFFYWPMALTIAGLKGDAFALFHVGDVFKGIFRGGIQYACVVIVGVVLLAAGYQIAGAVFSSDEMFSGALFGPFHKYFTVVSASMAYAAAVQGHMIGRMIAESPRDFDEFRVN